MCAYEILCVLMAYIVEWNSALKFETHAFRAQFKNNIKPLTMANL